MSNVAPLPVVVPLTCATVLLLGNRLMPRRVVYLVAGTAIAAEMLSAVLLLGRARSANVVSWFGGWSPRAGVALGVSFTVDQLGASAALLSGVIVTAALLSATTTVRDAEGIVGALLMTLLAGMAGFCLTGDLFNMFVFFELMAVSAIALAAYHTESVASLRSALNFAITNGIGGFLVLIAIAMLYSRTGALNLAQIGHALGTKGPDRLVVVALSLLLVGFLVKAAVIPFHFWLVDTVTFATMPLVVVLAGALDVLGVYAIARVYWTVFAGSMLQHEHAVRAALIAIGAVSALAAAVLSIGFSSPRRRLAFVLISHTGLLVIGIGCLSAGGVAATALYAGADGMIKAALVLGVMLAAATGRARRAGAAVLTVGGLATAGLPVFATGLGKAAIEDATTRAGFGPIVIVIVVAAALTGATLLEIAVDAWRRTTKAAEREPARGWLLLAVGAGLLLAGSAALGAAGRSAGTAAARFVDTTAYQASVLTGTVGRRVTAGVPVSLTGRGAALDLLAVAAAVVLAAALPAMRRSLRRRPVMASWNTVRRLHAGSVGDSVTWLVVGATILSAVLVPFRR